MPLVVSLILFVGATTLVAFGLGFFGGVEATRVGTFDGRNVKPISYGSLVKRFGTYELPSGDRLVVWKEQTSLVRCRLEDKQGRVLVQSHPEFDPSDAMKWGIVVDDSNWLWFNSSDVGNVVWIPDTDGNYTKHPSAGPNVDPAIKAKRPPNLTWRD